MKKRTWAFCAALALAVLSGGSQAQAQNQTTFSFHLPYHIMPNLKQMVGNQCSGGYSRQSYQGRTTCIACQAGYTYTKLNGGDNCVRCQPGYSYVINATGRNLCVRCPAGYTFTAQGGRNFCLRR